MLDDLSTSWSTNMKLVFFYGTLKRGHYNYERFKEGLTFLHESSVRGYSLVNANRYYPHAIPDVDGLVIGEVFEAEEMTARSIEGMEVGAGYKSVLVTTESGVECTMYYSDYEGFQ